MELLYDCFQQMLGGGMTMLGGLHAWCVMLMLGCVFEGGDLLLGT